MKFSLPKIYPITDTRISGMSHLEQVRRLVEGGASLIQLRDKSASPLQFLEAAEEVMSFARNERAKIIINDRVDIALAVGADGVHLGQDDLPPEEARKILGDRVIIGFSTHSPEQALDAIKMPVDYIAIGPVFSTSTRIDPDPVVGLGGLRSVRRVLGDFPMVAIGGITLDNAASVIGAGADSLALIRDVLLDADRISDRMRELSRTS